MKKPINHETNEVTSPAARREKALHFQLGVGIMFVAFVILLLLVVTFSTAAIDLNITRSLQSINNPFFSWLMTSISWVGFWPQSFIVTLLIIAIIYGLGYYWEATVSLMAVSLEGLLNLIVKTLIHRPRPSDDLVNVTKLLNSYSFPSGHVMFYTVFFGFLCFLIFTFLKPFWLRNLLLLVLGSHIVLIGLSRIYLGEHWTTDVVAAYLLGGLCLLAFIQLYRLGKMRFSLH